MGNINNWLYHRTNRENQQSQKLVILKDNKIEKLQKREKEKKREKKWHIKNYIGCITIDSIDIERSQENTKFFTVITKWNRKIS